MPKRKINEDAPLQSLKNASYLTGLSVGFLRQGCQKNEIPHVMIGKEYRIHIPALLRQLEAASMEMEATQ